MPFLLIGLSFLLFWFSFRSLKRNRLFEDLPTSKTLGVFIGLVELKGTAESENPHTSFLAEKKCVWYSWSVQEHWSRTVTETYHDKDGKPQTRTRTESGWKTVASGGETDLFYLKDECGIVRINPENAEIHANSIFNETVTTRDPLYYGKGPETGISNSTGRRCFSEKGITLHQPIYVIGQARERKDCVAAEVAYDRDAPVFMISTSTEESHSSWELWIFWLCGI
ncbi:MAG: GIDE domain-containing protein, partial [Thermoguttaceae bacterium]